MPEPAHQLEHPETEGRPPGAPRISDPTGRAAIADDASGPQSRETSRPARADAINRLRPRAHTETR